jgi:hypothetical protein
MSPLYYAMRNAVIVFVVGLLVANALGWWR